MQAEDASFDEGFKEPDNVLDETTTSREFQIREDMGKFRSLFVFFGQSWRVHAARGNRCDVCIPSPGPFPWTQKTKEALGAYPVRGSILLWSAIRSMAANRQGFVSGIESMT